MQKIGNHQHLRRSKVDAFFKDLRKVGSEPGHETHFDERITVFLSKTSSDPLHILPCFRHPASMTQKYYSLVRSGCFLSRFKSLTIGHAALPISICIQQPTQKNPVAQKKPDHEPWSGNPFLSRLIQLGLQSAGARVAMK